MRKGEVLKLFLQVSLTFPQPLMENTFWKTFGALGNLGSLGYAQSTFPCGKTTLFSHFFKQPYKTTAIGGQMELSSIQKTLGSVSGQITMRICIASEFGEKITRILRGSEHFGANSDAIQIS